MLHSGKVLREIEENGIESKRKHERKNWKEDKRKKDENKRKRKKKMKKLVNC